ncbi:MAG: 2-oxoglutarate ferredoxin oxidoreductase subunit beta [Chlorobium sp.]|nr:MAG: 2-oxoglutarate ferredoxin oxidoreductase subunit beta [Chlorobium sp.]
MSDLTSKYLRAEKAYGTSCRGCGLRLAHHKVLEAIDRSGLTQADIVWGTGIGCSGRQTYATWKGDTFAGTHGRVYAMATGLRLALPPEKKILLTVGDGDAYTIGLQHLLNCARRNVGVTVVVLDNLGYQSTGGQYSITTPEGSVTDSSPRGTWEQNWAGHGLDVLKIVKEAGATFIARHTVLRGEGAVSSIAQALQNPGFSLVQIVYPCVSHFGVQTLGTRAVPEVYKWFESYPLSTGILWNSIGSRPEFSEAFRQQNNNIKNRKQDV